MEGGAPLSCETEPLELARTGASTSRQCAFLLQAGASLSFHAVATGAAGDGRYSLMITVTRLQ
jgi:hypothetical protein